MSTTVHIERSASAWRELDSREADAGRVHVTLLWHSETQRTLVEVEDRATGESLHIEPQPGQRVYPDIYEYPYAYADQAWEHTAFVPAHWS